MNAAWIASMIAGSRGRWDGRDWDTRTSDRLAIWPASRRYAGVSDPSPLGSSDPSVDDGRDSSSGTK